MYGVSGLFGDIADVRAHGRDERVGIAQFYDSQEFLYRLVKRYADREVASCARLPFVRDLLGRTTVSGAGGVGR